MNLQLTMPQHIERHHIGRDIDRPETWRSICGAAPAPGHTLAHGGPATATCLRCLAIVERRKHQWIPGDGHWHRIYEVPRAAGTVDLRFADVWKPDRAITPRVQAVLARRGIEKSAQKRALAIIRADQKRAKRARAAELDEQQEARWRDVLGPLLAPAAKPWKVTEAPPEQIEEVTRAVTLAEQAEARREVIGHMAWDLSRGLPLYEPATDGGAYRVAYYMLDRETECAVRNLLSLDETLGE